MLRSGPRVPEGGGRARVRRITLPRVLMQSPIFCNFTQVWRRLSNAFSKTGKSSITVSCYCTSICNILNRLIGNSL